MSKKQTLIIYYSIVALVCTGMVAGFSYWAKLRKQQSFNHHMERKQERFEDIRLQQREKFKAYGLKESFTTVNQHGKAVDLKTDLLGKVVVFVQFYAACPHCDGINMKLLKEVCDKYSKHEDLRIVAVNVNAEAPETEKLMAYWQKKADKSPHWMFLNGDVARFNDWAVQNLAFARFEKNTGDNAAIEPVNHDMGIVVIKRDGTMFAKEDYYSALAVAARENDNKEENEAFAEGIKKELMEAVKIALEN